MQNPDSSLLDQLNITTVIAILGLIISLWTAITSFLSKRRQLEISIQAYCVFGNSIRLSISFENHSQLPIAITNIKVVQGTERTSCAQIPIKIGERRSAVSKHEESVQEFFSERIPIQISSLGAISCLIAFDNLPEPPETAPKSLTLEVCTNRGRAFQKTLQLTKEALRHRVPFE